MNVRHVSAFSLEERAVQLEAAPIGIGVDNARDADRVVVGQQFPQPGEVIGVAWRGLRRPRPDVAPAVAQDAGRLAGRVLLDVAGPPSVTLKFASMPLSVRASELSDASGPVGRRPDAGAPPVEFRARRIALLAEARDEDLRQRDPAPGLGRPGARPEVREHVRDGLHVRDRVVELVHRRAGGCTCESISPGSTVLPPRWTCCVSGPASFTISAFMPTATMRPSRIAMASTVRNCGSTVTIFPVWKMWLGGGSRCQPAARTNGTRTWIRWRFIGGLLVWPARDAGTPKQPLATVRQLNASGGASVAPASAGPVAAG